MPRLIDANALLSAIDEYMVNAYDCPLNEVADFQRASNDTRVIYAVEGLYEATEIIEEAPTVDAVEVVHGRWVATNPINNFSCSCCKSRYISVFVKTWNYCPNCGARMMDGDGNG